jgi:NAD(P)-dependent dehydrogenase (short-subunit alcohol dehydrogenase family)
MQIDLSNTSVLVTGASRGIGAAIARAMGTAGAKVAIHYRDRHERAAALAKQIGACAEVFQADLSKTEDCSSLWKSVVARFGRVDTLVNNAGVAISSPLESNTQEWLQGWETTMAVNLRAPSILCRLAIAHFM